MEKFVIITDSSSDLPKEFYEKNQIVVEPFTISVNEKELVDGDLAVMELFELAEKEKAIPKTAAVSPARFMEIFEKVVEAGKKAVYIGLGSGFSSTLQNAVIGKEDFEGKIYVIDSGNLSSGTGLLLLKLVKFRDEGLSIEESVAKIEALVPLVRTQFAISTLEYLHKGGRCSGTARFFGTLLKIYPIVRVIDGKMEVAKKGRGRFENALDIVFDYFESDYKDNNIDLDCVMVTHPYAPKDAKYLKEKLAAAGVKNILETNAGCTIATHCGPRTIGILYIKKH
ncbi:MAG: DegV family protein [Bacilli bacterium]|jgi:DegV family protein with EDD domain